ncbi:MAG: site-specific DNA-methyltransferase [Candidatus Paceibacterota bacterium]|jgi:DNA modification methylase
MKKVVTNLVLGDCESVLKNIKDNSIDLIITSPPYTDQRADTYGGVKPNDYVKWFMPKSQEFLRVLKPKGTFILNIKEATVDKEKSLYVLNLILALKEQGWHWTEEFIWHKKNSFPGKWPNRFRDAWERLLQFNKQTDFNMYQEEVMVPIGKWAEGRLKNLSEADKKRTSSKAGSGFGRKVSNWSNRGMVYPTNVLNIATQTANKNHSAVYPEALPEWFIKLFSKKDDWVLDPFAGSGTTLKVAEHLHRNSIGVEIMPKYYKVALKNLNSKKGIPEKIKRRRPSKKQNIIV